MKKQEIIDILKKYNFDKSKYLVISGAAMVLLGIKEETSDIDIAVTKDYYNYLLDNYNTIFDRYNVFNNKCYIIDDIINFGVDYFDDERIIINNIPVQVPQQILDLKIYLNRKKDISDIEKIKKYIEEKNV